jgi:aminotransferase
MSSIAEPKTAAVAERMDTIPFSRIRTILERVTLKERAGAEIIHMEIGQPDFDTPVHIRQAAKDALDDGHTRYTSNYGVLPLRKAIARKLQAENGLTYDPRDEITVTAGAAEAIMMAMMALLNPGDEVLVQEPQFLAYVSAIRMAGAIPVGVSLDPSKGSVAQALEAAGSSRTRMIVLATPNNPTGAVVSRATMDAISRYAIAHDLFVVADEIYEKLIYEDQEHVSIAALPGMRSRTITLNGFSKSYAMTGWRIGYVVADRAISHALVRIHQYAVVCANAFAQWGALAALTGEQHCVELMRCEFDRRRRLLINSLGEVPGLTFTHPQGAFYLYADVSALHADAYQLAEALLEQAQIAVVPWDATHLRISYSTHYDNLARAMARMPEVLTGHHDEK